MHCFAFVFTCDYAPDKHMACGGKMNIKQRYLASSYECMNIK